MFGQNSRYKNVEVVETESLSGQKKRVVKLRRLPYVGGNLTEVRDNDRLDLMAHRKYGDGTLFWHIADANTELEAARLTERREPENPLARREEKLILVPES